MIRAVLAGSPGGIAKAVGRDLPLAMFTMVATIAFTSVALELTDAISDWVWAGTRDDAKRALDQLALLLRTGLPGPALRGCRAGVAGAAGDGLLVDRPVRP